MFHFFEQLALSEDQLEWLNEQGILTLGYTDLCDGRILADLVGLVCDKKVLELNAEQSDE